MITQLIYDKGFVSLGEIVETVGISESTARRDLEVLEGKREILRTRGGATLFTPQRAASLENPPEDPALVPKQKIATFIESMIEPDETILLDGGTTTLEVARRIVATQKPVQIVTNSLPIADAVLQEPQIELILLGGVVSRKTRVMLGPHVIEALNNVHATKVVMGCAGITEKGLYNQDSLLVHAQLQMMTRAGAIFVAADSSKFGKLALCHLCGLEIIDALITDNTTIPPQYFDLCRDCGTELIALP